MSKENEKSKKKKTACFITLKTIIVMCVCVHWFLPDQVVIAYKHQVLQYREEIGLCTAVLHRALHNTEHVTCISAESQGLVLKLKHFHIKGKSYCNEKAKE